MRMEYRWLVRKGGGSWKDRYDGWTTCVGPGGMRSTRPRGCIHPHRGEDVNCLYARLMELKFRFLASEGREQSPMSLGLNLFQKASGLLSEQLQDGAEIHHSHRLGSGEQQVWGSSLAREGWVEATAQGEQA